jgi:hypothetical protein
VTIDVENLKKYLHEEPYDQPLLLSTLTDIAQLVIFRHFSSHVYRLDDLVSLGIEKAVVMLKRPDVKTGAKLVNFLYTGMRNTIGNDIKKEKRCYCNDMQEAVHGPVDASSDICVCDLREALGCHVSEMSNRLRALGHDPRKQIRSFFNGKPGDPISRLIVRVAASKVMLER